MSAAGFLLSRTCFCLNLLLSSCWIHHCGNMQPQIFKLHSFFFFFLVRSKCHICFNFYLYILSLYPKMSVLIYSRNMRHDCYILCHVSSNTDRFFLLCLQDTAVVYISTVFWYNLTQTGFCETLLNTHLFVCKRKRLHVSLYSPETSLTIPTRFPHFSASHLFFLSSTSSFSLCFSPHLSPSLASYTCRLMCFAKSLRAGDDIT